MSSALNLVEQALPMEPISIWVGATLLVWSLVHFGFACFFRIIVVRKSLGQSDWEFIDENGGKVSVLLSLRGCDPFLVTTLKRLLEQTYRNFEIIAVIDSRQDPSWKVAEQIQSQHDHDNRFRILELVDPRSTCGLKCSSLVQATQHIADDSEFVVLIDADVVPYADWLKDVLRPLRDPRIGVVTGGQWFSPERPEWGSLMRSVWNSGAMVATAINGNPWAGTCAMRLSDLRRSGLVEKWTTSIVDDGPIKPVFGRLGLKVYFEPKLLMINRDQCSAKFAGTYVTRMLTWSRIFEKTFVNTVLHAVAMAGLWGAAALSFVVDALLGNSTVVFVGFALLLSNLLMFAGFGVIRQTVRDAISFRSGHDSIAAMTWGRSIRMFLLIPLCHFTHLVWTFRAIFARQAKWREITYRFLPRQSVEMVAYHPYVGDADTTTANASI